MPFLVCSKKEKLHYDVGRGVRYPETRTLLEGEIQVSRKSQIFSLALSWQQDNGDPRDRLLKYLLCSPINLSLHTLKNDLTQVLSQDGVLEGL